MQNQHTGDNFSTAKLSSEILSQHCENRPQVAHCPWSRWTKLSAEVFNFSVMVFIGFPVLPDGRTPANGLIVDPPYLPKRRFFHGRVFHSAMLNPPPATNREKWLGLFFHERLYWAIIYPAYHRLPDLDHYAVHQIAQPVGYGGSPSRLPIVAASLLNKCAQGHGGAHCNPINWSTSATLSERLERLYIRP